MTAIARLRDEIARLDAMIGQARARVAAGSTIDLAPLGDGVSALCAIVAVLPEEQGRGLRDELEALSARLGRLGADIQARLEAAAAERS